MNKNGKKILLLLLLMFSTQSFADEIENRAELIASLYWVVTTFAILMGLILMALGALKLKKRAENPNDPKSFPGAIIMTFVAGALMFNYSGSSDTMIQTVLGDDASHCFIFNGDISDSNDLHEDNCWDSSSSSLLGDAADRIEGMTPGDGDGLMKNAEVIVGLFQLFGMIYFLKGIYSLKMTSEGSGREGYGKPIITMIAAALVIDLPHTLETIQETIIYLGFGG